MNEEPVYRPNPEPVVLDIGGTRGALVVRAGPDQIDVPIEISPTGQDANRSHQHVLERPMPEQTAYAAVFDRLEQGSYTLWMHDRVRVRELIIEGGSVTELDWSNQLPEPTEPEVAGDGLLENVVGDADLTEAGREQRALVDRTVAAAIRHQSKSEH